jgi:galactose mutarotase-like enzyme
MVTIDSEYFSIGIKEIGAELCSIKSKHSGKEYMWQANPEVWAAHAPNLFPIIGCLKGGSFIYGGMEYACPKHGFVRNNDKIALVEKTATQATFALSHSVETLMVYPFEFEFRIQFALNTNILHINHSVMNHGDEALLFSLGGHPAFRCPVNENESYSDYFLEFEKPETAQSWQVQKDGYIDKDTVPVFDTPTTIRLHPHLFDNDALVFKNLNSNSVCLKSNKSSQKLTVYFPDFDYLGIWAKPNAAFVCIEPWLGIADSYNSDRHFENKEGLIKLEADQQFHATYSIEISE